MSKPRRPCSFCGQIRRLSKGHIWPESFGEFLPSDAMYHEQRIGKFDTFESTIPGPEKWERVGTGPLHKRRPRNTCQICNSGWMSKIESAALPIAKPLILGEPSLLDTRSQRLLAAVLSLISTRIEFTAQGMKTVPQSEIATLMETFVPSNNWRVWVARHAGTNLREYLHRYTAMQLASEPTAKFGPEYCNTHVSALIAGQFYAHVFFSTVWPDFSGYDGVNLTRVWPANEFSIDTRFIPAIDDETGVLLHEAISREGKRVPV
jgi:hypothetical protein